MVQAEGKSQPVVEKEKADIKEAEPAKEEKETVVEGKKDKAKEERKAQKKAEEATVSKKLKALQCKVVLLDGAEFQCELDVRRESFSTFLFALVLRPVSRFLFCSTE